MVIRKRISISCIAEGQFAARLMWLGRVVPMSTHSQRGRINAGSMIRGMHVTVMRDEKGVS